METMLSVKKAAKLTGRQETEIRAWCRETGQKKSGKKYEIDREKLFRSFPPFKPDKPEPEKPKEKETIVKFQTPMMTCTDCKEIKPETAFSHRDSKTHPQKRYKCNTCLAEKPKPVKKHELKEPEPADTQTLLAEAKKILTWEKENENIDNPVMLEIIEKIEQNFKKLSQENQELKAKLENPCQPPKLALQGPSKHKKIRTQSLAMTVLGERKKTIFQRLFGR